MHEQAREVLTFVFHGRYKSPNGCDVPVIREIHKAMQTVVYRFTHTIDQCFHDIMMYVNKNKSASKFFTDKGIGKPSKAYLAAWENGFRNAALNGYVIVS